jgi:hypothetical protein
MLAAEWTGKNRGPYVDTEGAAAILGVTPQYVARLAAQERLPWGCRRVTLAGANPARVYRGRKLKVMTAARNRASPITVG